MPRRKRKDESSESYESSESSSEYYSSSESPPPKKKRGSRKSSSSKKKSGKKEKRDRSKSKSKSKSKSRKSTKDKKKGKKRARKPAGYPKGVKSAYIFFTNENRARMKAEHSGATFGELSKLLGTLWKNTPEEERKKFIEMNSEDKKRHDKEMAEYKEKHPDKDSESDQSSSSSSEKKVKKKPKKQVKKDPNAPKKPANSFFLYSQEQRLKVKEEITTNGSSVTINKELGNRWAALSEEEKQPYVDKAKELRENYKVTMEEYNKAKDAGTLPASGTEAVEKKGKKEKNLSR